MKLKVVFLSLLLSFMSVMLPMEKSDNQAPLCTQLFNKKFDVLSHKTVVGALGLEKISITLIKHALDEFIRGNLAQFDANTGDNLCQVRAKMITSAFNNKTCIDEIKHLIEHIPDGTSIQKEADEIEKTVKSGKQADIKRLNAGLKGLSSLLANKSIGSVSLSSRVKSLVLSNIITRFYSDIPQERKKKIEEGCTVLKLAAGKLSDLLKESRILLNKLTVSCLDDDAKNSNNSLCIALVKQKEQCGSFVVPSTYGGIVTLLTRIEQERIPVVLKTKVICPDHGIHEIQMNKVKGDTNKNACFVIEGVSDPCKVLPSDMETTKLEERVAQRTITHDICPTVVSLKDTLEAMSLQDIVLANAAMHSQFVDKQKTIDFTQLGEHQKQVEDTFAKYQQLAIEKGLCKENGSMFRIIHIFADVNNNTQ